MDSRTSLQMIESDLTPEEQETTQKSEDSLVILSASGTTHRTQEETNSICRFFLICSFKFKY